MILRNKNKPLKYKFYADFECRYEFSDPKLPKNISCRDPTKIPPNQCNWEFNGHQYF